MNDKILLEIKNIKKTFGDVQALNNLSFNLKEGKILGLLGENGAGKSTVISIITGDMKYDEGRILYRGRVLEECKRDYQVKLGYVPQEIALFSDLNCFENLNFWAHVYKIEKSKIRDRIDEVAEIFEISDVLKRFPNQLSGGYQRRLNIACAILHQPEILFLDEPTVGIDVSIRKSILKTVRSFAKEGMAILYTSHYIDELEEISDEVLIIKDGKEIAFLDREEFKDGSLEKTYLSLI